MSTHRVTVELPGEVFDLLRSKIDSGEYAGEAEAIAEAIQMLDLESPLQTDANLEAWLREDVVPIALEMEEHPERFLTEQQVIASLAQDRRMTQCPQPLPAP